MMDPEIVNAAYFALNCLVEMLPLQIEAFLEVKELNVLVQEINLAYSFLLRNLNERNPRVLTRNQ